VGFTRGLYEPALGAVTADVVPAPDRVRAFSLLYWAQNLATGVAALGGGLLAVFDLRLVFAADALTSLAAAVLVVATIPETRPDDVPRHIAAAPLTPWRDAAFLSLCATGLLVGLVFGQHLSGLPLSMSADGLPARAYGLVIALNTAMIGAVQLLAPKLLAGRDPSRVLAATALTAGVGFGLSGLADSTWGYAGSVVVWTAAEICMAPSTSALIAALAPATARGRYQGLYGLAGGAGFALAPVLGGALLAGFGAGALWFGCVVAGLVAATIHLLSAPIRRRRLLPAGSGG
jgi:MFS family permease